MDCRDGTRNRVCQSEQGTPDRHQCSRKRSRGGRDRPPCLRGFSAAATPERHSGRRKGGQSCILWKTRRRRSALRHSSEPTPSPHRRAERQARAAHLRAGSGATRRPHLRGRAWRAPTPCQSEHGGMIPGRIEHSWTINRSVVCNCSQRGTIKWLIPRNLTMF